MTFLDLISTWPQFILHIIINDIAPFNEIIGLAQTCKELNTYFHRIKAYSLLCGYNTGKINGEIFKNPCNFYVNHYEKQLFQKIYKYQKNKPNIAPIKNGYLVTIEYYFDNFGSEYLKNIIDNVSDNGHINIIEWLYGHPDLEFKYSKDAVDWAANKGYINIIEWFYNHSDLEFKYSKKAVNRASENGHINIIEWFYNHSFDSSRISEYSRTTEDQKKLEFKYSKDAVDQAADRGHINIVKWFYEHPDLEFKYSKYAVNWAAANGHINILEWFYNHSDLEFKYSEAAVDWAANAGHIDIIEWFYNCSRYSKTAPQNRKIEFKYSNNAVDWATRRGHIHILEWFKNHPELKYTS